MAHSSYQLDLVIVAQADGGCFWTTPSNAARACAANPTLEIIDEEHPHYPAWLKAAGPKPTVFIPAKEGYSDED